MRTWKSFILHILAILATAYVCCYGTAINSLIVIASVTCGSDGASVSTAIQGVFCIEVPSNGTWSTRHILIEKWDYFSWTWSDTPYCYVQGCMRHYLTFELLLDVCSKSVTLNWLDSLSNSFSYLGTDMPLLFVTFL